MSNRATFLSALLIGLAGLYACWCDVALLWDGAYQFCSSLVADRPFLYLSRFHSGVVWQPFIWLSHATENLRLLKMAWGAPFCFAPLAGVLLSWWIVRRAAPHLMLWALFGVAIAPLPGQIFMINDSIFQVHFWWPVFFATFLTVTRGQLAVVLLVSLLQLSHPIGIGICFLCALAALAFAAWGTPERRGVLFGWAVWHLALATGGVAKLIIWPDSYAAHEASLERALGTLLWGVLPCSPGLLAAWAAAALFVWRRAQPASQRALWWSRAALPLLALTALTWAGWASSPMFWQTAINYRRWVFPMCMPFLLAAGWELWRLGRETPMDSELQRGRDHAGLASAAIFFLVLGLQSFGWSRLFHRLTDQVAAAPGPWLKPGALAWTHLTPLDHWGLASQIMVVQGRRPRVLLWSPADEQGARAEPPQIALSSWNHVAPTTLPHGWFDWAPFLREVHQPAERFPAGKVDLP